MRQESVRFTLFGSDSHASAAVPVARFDIGEIAASLRLTQQHFRKINKTLNARRSPLSDDTLANMLAGYRQIDKWLADGTDLLAMGNSSLIFEINTLVLCGTSQKRRASFAFQIERSKEYFYDNEEGGIGSLMEWSEFHSTDNIWKKAAGLYIQIMSRPQLFIEGNHRSAALLVSFLLGKEGYPPFVLTARNARELLNQSKQISDLKKHGIGALILLPKLRARLAETLKSTIEPRHRMDCARRPY